MMLLKQESNDVYWVKREKKEDAYSALKEIVVKVDSENNEIIIKPLLMFGQNNENTYINSFPEMFDVFNHSILGRAQNEKILEINCVNIRDYANNKHKKVDDYPYGGGAGMVMTPQPIVDCIEMSKG